MTLTTTEVDGLTAMATKYAAKASYMSGLEAEEALSLFLLDVAEYPDEYGVLYREQMHNLIKTKWRRVAQLNARADRIRKMAERGEVSYHPQYVRLFLPFYFDRQDWPSGPADGVGSKPGNSTTDAIDTALDMRNAIERLKSWQQQIIGCRHLTGAVDANGETDWETIATECGYANGEVARKQYEKATYQLSVEMNIGCTKRTYDHDGPGGRKAMKNTTAIAVLANQ